MRCTGSTKSSDSTMLSCLSPRSPCCGPNAAVSRKPVSPSASSECTSSCVTDAGCARSATRRPASGLRNALSSTRRSMPSFIELQGECVRVMEIGLAGRMTERPLRARALLVLDHCGETDPNPSRRISDLCRQLEPSRRPYHDDGRVGDGERTSFPVTGELVRGPFPGWREIEFPVSRQRACDEHFAAGVPPQALGGARRARRRDAQAIDLALQHERDLQAFRFSFYGSRYAAQRVARGDGMALERGGRHGRASL